MKRHLFNKFNEIFDKGDSFSIILVLEQLKPAFYDSKGINSKKYTELVKLIKKVELSFPHIELFVHKDLSYKPVIFDNSKNKLEIVRDIYQFKPITKLEIDVKIQKEAKLLGYPTVLLDLAPIRNRRNTQAYFKWYYVTFILSENETNIGEIYSFFCRQEYFGNIQNEIQNRRKKYNEIAKQLDITDKARAIETNYKVLICIEENVFTRKIF